MTVVVGEDDGTGYGVIGRSVAPNAGRGVEGDSSLGDGVYGLAHARGKAGVHGTHVGHFGGFGVLGEVPNGAAAVKGQYASATGMGADEAFGAGVAGDSSEGPGVVGTSSVAEGVLGEGERFGVRGASGDGPGVNGVSERGEGVHGETNNPNTWVAGVAGVASSADGLGPGVSGTANGLGPGVYGRSDRSTGVLGFHGDPERLLAGSDMGNYLDRAGVFGASDNGSGVVGYAKETRFPAVAAYGGLQANAMGNAFAGSFEGDVRVSGTIKAEDNIEVTGDVFLTGADCAEQFDAADECLEPGTVVGIDADGKVRKTEVAYDSRVAGIVSGAGRFRPALVMDHAPSETSRVPIALIGKVYCHVDARCAAIEAGDLLTSSDTPGRAMKVTDRSKATGTVIGKALGSLHAGLGTIPILVGLR